MVTTETWQRRSLFRNERWAKLLIDTLYHYRGSAYLLHEFVIMPDHIHILITSVTSLEKAVQFIKGGFSYLAKKELGSNMEIWQKGFQDQRVRDAADYDVHANYIHQNPVRKGLCGRAEEYPNSSAHFGFALDAVPQGLKPIALAAAAGAPEGAPLQSGSIEPSLGNSPERAPFQGVVNQDHIGEPTKATAKFSHIHRDKEKTASICNYRQRPMTNDQRPTSNA